MALTKVQLMEVPGGPGVVGAVKAGNGITIGADGSVSLNSAQTITKVTAGAGIRLTPSSGFGDVTVSVDGSAGGVVTKLIAGANVTLSPVSGTGDVTISASGGGGGGAVSSVSGSGNGISVSPTTGAVVVQNTGVTRINAGSNISVSSATGEVTINATGGGGGTITGVTAGTGLSGGGTSGNVTLNNTGVTRINAGSNITVSANTGEITISSSGGGSSSIPSGTIMLFLQGSAPTGWSQVNNDYEDRALRLIGGGGGGATSGAGGFLEFMQGTYSYDGQVTFQNGSTSDATLSSSQDGPHTHDGVISSVRGSVLPGGALFTDVTQDFYLPGITGTQSGGSGQGHAHNMGGRTCDYAANARFNVKTINVIACQKQ